MLPVKGNVNFFGVFPKCFSEFTEFSDKNICHYSKRARTCHPATFGVTDQNATTPRHMWETGSEFAGLRKFAEFSESSALFRKNPTGYHATC